MPTTKPKTGYPNWIHHAVVAVGVHFTVISFGNLCQRLPGGCRGSSSMLYVGWDIRLRNLSLTRLASSSQRDGCGGSLGRCVCRGSNDDVAFLFGTTGSTGTVSLVAPRWGDEGPLAWGWYRDGSWRRQIGMNFSIYAALVSTNLPWKMLMIPCLCSLPSWRTLQRKLFLRLLQYQNVSVNHGFFNFYL